MTVGNVRMATKGQLCSTSLLLGCSLRSGQALRQQAAEGHCAKIDRLLLLVPQLGSHGSRVDAARPRRCRQGVPRPVH